MDNLYRLIKNGIKSSQYSLAGVADHLGIAKGILTNKLNPFSDSNRLSLKEFIAIADFTGNMAALRQIAYEFGYLLVERNATPQQCINTQAVRSMADLGDLMKEIGEAQADGNIDVEELDRIESKAQKLIDGIVGLRATAAQQAKNNIVNLERRS